MRIKDARRVRQERSPQGFHTLCRFNLEATEGLLIFDCTLVRAPDGRIFVYGPPSKRDGQLVSMAPEVRRQIISMTLDAAGIDDSEHHYAA